MTFTVAGGPANRYDWVGLYCPSTLGDDDHINWKYLSNSQSSPSSGQSGATITFTAPSSATTCNARFFIDNGYTKQATSQTVTVQ
jgi:hypothetical protein